MENPTRAKVPGYRSATIAAAIILIVLYVGLAAAVVVGGVIPPPMSPDSRATPQVTATPHILVHIPAAHQPVRPESFALGLREWYLAGPQGKMENVGHSMILQSYEPNRFAIAMNQNFLGPARKYYLQADLATDVPTWNGYGLVFGSDDQVGSFYSFVILPRLRSCQLRKFSQGKWHQLSNDRCAGLAPYPQANTLSTYFDDGRIEVYVNGRSVASYTDAQPLRSTGLGAYISDAGFRVVVDNIFAYVDK